MSEKYGSNLTRKQKLVRRTLSPVLVMAIAGGGFTAFELSGSQTISKEATALMGKLFIKAGTKLHTSPSQDILAESESDASGNVAEKVPKGKVITVESPIVKKVVDEYGNETVWLGFEDVSAGYNWRWIAASTIDQQQLNSGTTFVSMYPAHDKSYGNDNLLYPSRSDEAKAEYNDKTGQYEVNKKPVAVGVETSSADTATVN